ncbi:MAG: ribosome small subunit-dependent GTPase A [Anaerolineaceae bacterium]|nr:ribosome small subunit-dependent GTPase A [Anaerolineaceae bacterium]
MTELLPGLIIRSQAGFMSVHTEQGVYNCRVRGKLRKGRASGDLAAVGDRVLIEPQEDMTGSIAKILPRSSVLSRALSGVSYAYQQVILANADQILIVFACQQPEPHLRMLDRFLVVAERAQIPAIIVVTKLDLTSQATAESIFGLYQDLGYPVIYTSSRTNEGIEKVKSYLPGKISSLAGPSGVGKTSLLQNILPNLQLQVGQVGAGAQGKGRHTTQVRQLYPLEGGGWLADTPGLRTLALWDITETELDAYYREIAPLVADCQFNDCTHSHEPGCAVRRAVEEGGIAQSRYDSYLRLRFGDKRSLEEDISQFYNED